MTARSVGVLAFDAMDVLDFAGPYEVFSLANRLSGGETFDVRSIGVHSGPVTAGGGFTVLPSTTTDDCTSTDVLVVPGGPGARILMSDEPMLEWVRTAAQDTEVLVSVCTGALVLGAAGLLAGRPATTHHRSLDQLRAVSPTTSVVQGQRFVQSSERIWTSGGISAGIDLSLHLVELLVGAEVRREAEDLLEWRW